jgi:hypothetical protein
MSSSSQIKDVNIIKNKGFKLKNKRAKSTKNDKTNSIKKI